MRIRSTWMALVACAALAAPERAPGQERDTLAIEATLAPAVAREAAARYNAALGMRTATPTRIEASQTVEGDIGVLESPLVVAGSVRGSIVVINGSVTLLPGARVDGDILVVGGVVGGLDAGRVRGEVRAYQARMRYRRDGPAVVADGAEVASVFSWDLVRQRRERPNGIRFRSYNSYNRVEGLPIYAGPYITRDLRSSVLTAELFGVIRTADNLAWSSENIGHRATLELRSKGLFQAMVGGRLHDVVEPIEPWQLPHSESGLATFFLHRDFRDWYGRHGGTVYAGVAGPRGFALTASLSDERWSSRRQRDPWTLFRDAETWRPNPTVDEGRFHVGRLSASIDTRNDPTDPWAGWLASVELERGAGRISRYGARSRTMVATSPTVVERGGPSPPLDPRYLRGFADVRRYNRLSPETQLNLRGVFAGWLGGDVLPLQRQVSIGGLGTIPGYDFRRGDESKTTCAARTTAPGRPAECDRVLLVQGEYRVNLGVENIMRTLIPTRSVDASLVVFVDAGRGWRVRDRDAEPDAFGRWTLPPVRTFQSDVGVGLDLSLFGIYVARGVSGGNPPPNVFVRVRHRF